MADPEVLIVGAGPTGLHLALRLSRYGIAFRIVDKANGPGEASRAMALHARTLEFYRQLGLADEVLAGGIPTNAMHLRAGGRRVATLSFEDIGGDVSPYPFVLTYPQDDHERLLVGQLEVAGQRVEWRTELVRLGQGGNGVEATLKSEGGEEVCHCVYVAGCDGVHSVVRHQLGLAFPGGTYPNRFYVVDARLAGEFDTDGVMNLGDETFALKLPVRSRGMQRLIGLVPPGLRDKERLVFDDIRDSVEHLLAVEVEEVNWFSSYRSHHRVADRFRVGRGFLAGDAGHVHSPAGGQGMNTGIGDAVNLAWKLAAVLKGRADAAILDTYESERIAFARKLVATTDNAFRVPTRSGAGGRFLRGVVLPHLVPVAFGVEAFRRWLFRTISQTRISYRATSTLSEGRAGRLRGGDRLPWVARMGADHASAGTASADNFAPLTSLGWQLHVYGATTSPLRAAAEELDMPLHTFAWSGGAARAGLICDAAYLVRPDGYLGLVLPRQDAGALRVYARRFGLHCAT